jgi:undecaprenyl-diphosphatase
LSFGVSEAKNNLNFEKVILGDWTYVTCRDLKKERKGNYYISDLSGGFSFTSSHATNHFGVATFLFVTLGRFFGSWKYLIFIWAALICYAQVYVGVHYPLDVLFGALLGFAIGHFVCWAYQKSDPLNVSHVS